MTRLPCVSPSLYVYQAFFFFFIALKGLPATWGFIELVPSHQGQVDLDSCSLWCVLCLPRVLQFTLGAHETQDKRQPSWAVDSDTDSVVRQCFVERFCTAVLPHHQICILFAFTSSECNGVPRRWVILFRVSACLLYHSSRCWMLFLAFQTRGSLETDIATLPWCPLRRFCLRISSSWLCSSPK